MENWTKEPEFKNYENFKDIEKMFNRLGLDFIKPVKSKWSYDISTDEFRKKVEELSLETKENQTEEEKWIIEEVLRECRLIKLRDDGHIILTQ